MSHTEPVKNWDVRVENGTVVVELPDGIELDQQTGQQINDEFFEAVGQPNVDSVLTLLRVENPLGSGLFAEVKRGSDEAAAKGVSQWAIHVQQKVKGMAFTSQIDELETKVFEDEQTARDWLS